MRVGTRLLLAVTPAIVGIFSVAALAYWGQYARQAPAIVIAVAVVASVGSLIASWQNSRYLAQRVAELAARAAHVAITGTSAAPAGDELDVIERSVHGLRDAVQTALTDRSGRELAAEQRVAEWDAVLEGVVGQLADGVHEVQLPLHILLESKFGELNENQEEMLEAARAAAETADLRVHQVQKFLALERGAVPMHPKPIGLAELLRPALAIASARASKRGLTLRADISASTARVFADPLHTQEALTLLLNDVVDRASAASVVVVEASDADARMVRIRVIASLPPSPLSISLRLAHRLIRAQRGALVQSPGELTVHLPAEQLSPPAR